MSNVSRHPSAPRRTPPPAQGKPLVIPVLVCATCKDPVVPVVRPGASWVITIVLFFMAVVPALLYLIWYELQKKTAVTCPACGRADLVPLDSTAAREILGERFDAVVARGKIMAGELARAQAESSARTQHLLGWSLLGTCALILAIVGAVWWFGREPARPSPEQEFAALQEESARAQAALAEARQQIAAPAPVEAPAPLPRLTISTTGTAASKPNGEPVMRVTAGEVYTLGEERDGWIRLSDAPVEAWVEAKAVTR